MSPYRVIKLTAFCVAVVLMAPLALLVRLEGSLSACEQLFKTFAQILALVPSHVGVVLRAAYYTLTLRQCSWEVHIGFGTLLTHRAATLRRHVSTGNYCVLGHVDIGEDVRLGSRVSIPSGKRQHLATDGSLSDESRFEQVRIGAHCWIGEGAIVLADVAEGCIVSAGAVVVSEIPERSVVGGNPARVLRSLA